MSPVPNFPVVSFAPFLHGFEDEQRKAAQQLYDAFSVYGWIYLKDFGISQEEVDELFATVSSQAPPVRTFGG
jgi:isopenicillin N synthase-like dioxygenase